MINLIYLFNAEFQRLKHSQLVLFSCLLLLNDVFLSGIPAVDSRWPQAEESFESSEVNS